MVDGRKVTVAKSITIHAAGKKNGSVTDAKSIKLKKASYVLAKGKKAAIKASIVKKDKKRPDHKAYIRSFDMLHQTVR